MLCAIVPIVLAVHGAISSRSAALAPHPLQSPVTATTAVIITVCAHDTTVARYGCGTTEPIIRRTVARSDLCLLVPRCSVALVDMGRARIATIIISMNAHDDIVA